MTVESVLPYGTHPMKTLASLIVQCVNEVPKKSAHLKMYCSEKEVMQNTTILRQLFPHLQALSLSGIYLTDSRAELNFPWDNQSMNISLNMMHSKFRQRLVTDGHSQHLDSYKIVRTLVVNVTAPVFIEKICPYDRQLNTIVLEGLNLVYIPLDCFTPSRSKPSILYFLELSENPLTDIANGTFMGLTKLESLHIRYCKLEDLQEGLFDDLTSLKLLNLDFNRLKRLRAGVFSKLISLEKLFLHYNELYHVEHRAFPVYSHNLTFVDLKHNKLEIFPYDCLTLPNLDLCNCANNSISIDNLTEVMSYFNPVKMYFVQPLAYYGETYNPTDVAIMHEADQAEVNLRNNNAKSVIFNSSWSP